MIVLNASVHQIFFSFEKTLRPNAPNLPPDWARPDLEHFREKVRRYEVDVCDSLCNGSVRELLSSGSWEPSKKDPTIQGALNLRFLESASTTIGHTTWMCNKCCDSTAAFKNLREFLRAPSEGEYSLQIVHARVPDKEPDPDPDRAATELAKWLSIVAITSNPTSPAVPEAFIPTPDSLLACGWCNTESETSRVWLSIDHQSVSPYSRWAFLCRGNRFETWLTKDFLNLGLLLLGVYASKTHEQLLWYARNKQTIERQQKLLRKRVREADAAPEAAETIHNLQRMGRVFESNLRDLERRLTTIQVNLKNLNALASQLGLDLSGQLGAPRRKLRQMVSQLAVDLRYHRNTLREARSSAFWARRAPADGLDRNIHILSRQRTWHAIPVEEWERQCAIYIEQIRSGADILVVDVRGGQNVIFSPRAPTGYRVGAADLKRLAVLSELMAYPGRAVDLAERLSGDAVDASWRQFRRRFDKALKGDGKEYLWLERQPTSGPPLGDSEDSPPPAYRFRHAAAEWYLVADAHARFEKPDDDDKHADRDQ